MLLAMPHIPGRARCLGRSLRRPRIPVTASCRRSWMEVSSSTACSLRSRRSANVTRTLSITVRASTSGTSSGGFRFADAVPRDAAAVPLTAPPVATATSIALGSAGRGGRFAGAAITRGAFRPLPAIPSPSLTGASARGTVVLSSRRVVALSCCRVVAMSSRRVAVLPACLVADKQTCRHAGLTAPATGHGAQARLRARRRPPRSSRPGACPRRSPAAGAPPPSPNPAAARAAPTTGPRTSLGPRR